MHTESSNDILISAVASMGKGEISTPNPGRPPPSGLAPVTAVSLSLALGQLFFKNYMKT